MKTKNSVGMASGLRFLKGIANLTPVAHGTLSFVRKPCNNMYCKLCKSGERHPAWNFTFRKDGKFHCMHVQPRHVETVRKAIENGRKLEEMILDEGIALLKQLREQD